VNPAGDVRPASQEGASPVANLPPGEAPPLLPGRQRGVTRRQLLRHSAITMAGSALGLTALAGCHHDTSAASRSTSRPALSTTPKASRTSTPSPAAPAAVGHVVAAERALLAAYDAAVTAHPGYAAPLAVLRHHHAQHLRALDPSVPTPTPTPTAAVVSSGPASAVVSAPESSAATASAATTPASSPPSVAETIAGLVTLERIAAAARLDDAATCTGSLARLIASIGGCEASHVVALSDLT
jgi:hypothetical protein